MYEQPQTEEIKLSMNVSLLAGSGGDQGGTPANPAPRYDPEW